MTGPLAIVAGHGRPLEHGRGQRCGTIASSAGTTVNGTLTNGPLFVTGTPFVSTANNAPNVPTNTAPTNGATGVSVNPTLQVGVSDPNGDPLTTSFYGRTAGSTAAEDFTIVVIPGHAALRRQRRRRPDVQPADAVDRQQRRCPERRLREPARRHHRELRHGRARVAARRRRHGHPRQRRDPQQPRPGQPRHEHARRGHVQLLRRSTSRRVATTCRSTRGTAAGSAKRPARSNASTRTTTSCSRPAASTS